MSHGLAMEWLRAARDAGVRAELEAVYSDVAAQVEARGPACWASGRCCHFEAAGHLLYVTGLEAAYVMVGVEEERQKKVVQAGGLYHGCLFQAANLCTVHGIKPLGCRVYFCDRSAQAWQQSLSEHGLAQIRGLHDRHGIEYRYGEWRSMLDQVARAISEPPTRRGGDAAGQ
jgi:Fe-S-cluster containining protein